MFLVRENSGNFQGIFCHAICMNPVVDFHLTVKTVIIQHGCTG